MNYQVFDYKRAFINDVERQRAGEGGSEKVNPPNTKIKNSIWKVDKGRGGQKLSKQRLHY